MDRISSKWWFVLAAFVLAAGIVMIWPNNRSGTIAEGLNFSDERAVVKQDIIGLYENAVEVTKVYYKNRLIGVLKNEQTLESVKKRAYKAYYQANFPNANIRYDDDIFFYREKTYNEYENKDDEIGYYMFNNDMFLVECYRIDIGSETTIYVKSLDDFRRALQNLAKMFINQDVYVRLENNEKIPSLTAIGEQDVNIYIEDTIKSVEASTNASHVMNSYEEILNYLCFGQNYELKYGTVRKYDTIDGFAMRYGLTSDQLVLINPSLLNTNQALVEGEQLIVTLFQPPLNVVVERERYVEEVIYPPSTKYITDNTIDAGAVIVEVAGNNGTRESLYKEIYVNGVKTSYRQVSTKVTKEAVQKVVRLGAKAIYYGDYDWRLPVDNPKITCGYGCYYGHTGVDFQNRYKPWSNSYVCGDGKVIANGWMNDTGWYVIIDHGQNFHFMYCHFRSKSPLNVGQQVVAGQFLGYVGMTGKTTGPHVHVRVTIKGVRIDPCTILPCHLAK